MKRVLIFRCDRIGDVINTVAMASQLKLASPGSHITFITSAYAQGVAGMCPDVDVSGTLQRGQLCIDGKTTALGAFLKQNRFDEIYCVHGDARTAYTIWRHAGPAKLIGPKAKWYSWLFFRHGKRQHRSLAQKHEAEYNQDLVSFPVERYLAPRLRVSEPRCVSRTILWHPFSGGSALTLSPQSICEMFCATPVPHTAPPIVFCGSELEASQLESLTQAVCSRTSWQASYTTFSSLTDYTHALMHAGVWVGPSTGPLHLAAALGIPVMTYFSPVRVHHPRRWGPYQASAPGSSLWMPPLICPGKRNCLGKACPHFESSWISTEACLRHLVTSNFLPTVIKTALSELRVHPALDAG